MPTPPYAKVLISVNAGANQSGGITAPSAATIQLLGESTVDWLQQKWELVDYPAGFTTPAGWSLDANGVIFSTSVTPQLFTLPSIATLWGKWMVRLTVNNGLSNGKDDPTLVDESSAFQTLSIKGQHDIGAREKIQFSLKGWVGELQATLRALESIVAGSPAGNGIAHVVGGSFASPATLIVNADVDPAAAIAGSKIAPNFGAQNVTTTGALSGGTLSVGTTFSVDANKLISSKGLRVAVTAITTNYTVLVTDEVIAVGLTGAATTVTLPASPTSGDTYMVKDENGGAATRNITIAGNGKNIDGAASLVIAANFASRKVVYTGAQWSVI